MVKMGAALMLAIGILLSGATPASAAVPPGELDKAFGDSGFASTGFGSQEAVGLFESFETGSDGTVFAVLDGAGTTVSRITPSGIIDPTYGTRGFARPIPALGNSTASTRAVAVQTGGRVVFAGVALGERSDRIVISRIDEYGQVDPDFGVDGFAGLSVPRLPPYSRFDPMVAIDSQDRILVVRRVRKGGCVLRRFTEDGQLDPTFGAAGEITFDFGSSDLRGIEVHGDRTFIEANGGVMVLDLDGAPVPGFGSGGVGRTPRPIGQGQFFGVQPDGGVIIATESASVVRLTPAGVWDEDFGDGGVLDVDGYTDALAIDPGGQILMSLSVNDDPRGDDVKVIRFSAGGVEDSSFGAGGEAYADIAGGNRDEGKALVVLKDGLILAGANRSPKRGEAVEGGIATFGPNGKPGSSTELIPVVPSRDVVLDMAFAPHGKIVAVGSAGRKAGVARFLRGGSLDRTFGDEGRLTIGTGRIVTGESARSVISFDRGQIIVCSDSRRGVSLWRYRADGLLANRFGIRGRKRIASLRKCGEMKKTSDGAILLSGTSIDHRVSMIKLKTDGRIVRGYGPGAGAAAQAVPGVANESSLALDVDSSGAAVITAHTRESYVVRFLPSGHIDESFGRNGTVRLHSKRESSGIFGFTRDVEFGPHGSVLVAGGSDEHLVVAKLKPDGRPVRNFGKNGLFRLPVKGTLATGLSVSPGGEIMVGGLGGRQFCLRLCPSRVLAVRLTPTGRIDPKFGDDGMSGFSSGLAVQAETMLLGRRDLILGGSVESAKERGQFMLTKIAR